MLLHNKHKCSTINIEPMCLVAFFFSFVATAAFIGLPRWFTDKGSACSAGDAGMILGSGRSPGEGVSTTRHSSSLAPGNLLDRGAWWTAVHGGHKGLDRTDREHARCFYYFLYLQHDCLTV